MKIPNQCPLSTRIFFYSEPVHVAVFPLHGIQYGKVANGMRASRATALPVQYVHNNCFSLTFVDYVYVDQPSSP